MNAGDPQHSRVILLYKGDISALTLFVRHASGSVCMPEALPPLSAVLERGEAALETVIQHPAMVVRGVADALGLPDDLIAAQPGFCERVETPGGVISVYLGRFMLLDPPHQWVGAFNSRLLPLTELRRQPPAELELLRRAYAAVMES